MAKEEQKQSTLGTPMPSNAAGPWRKFDAEDKATWPEKPGWYLVQAFGIFATRWWCSRHWHYDDTEYGNDEGTEFYAEILPPESSGE